MPLGLLMAGTWMWQRQSAQADFAGQLRMAVAQDIGGQRNRPLSSAAAPIMPAVIELPAVQINAYDRMCERIMAQVTVTDTADGHLVAYRQTRFYRQTPGQWQRIAPDAALLGPWQTLQTAHFIFRYRAADAAPVAAAAPRLDQLYEQLRRDVGLPAAGAPPVIRVEVSGSEHGSNFTLAEPAIVVPSPALLAAPVEMAAADILYQALVFRLAAFVVDDVIDRHHPSWQGGAVYWWPLLNALPLWAVWQEQGPLAMGRQEVPRWLFHNARTQAARHAVPDGYDRLCQLYRIWNLAPAEMSIPLSCTEADSGKWQARMAPALPLQLDALVYVGAGADGATSAPVSASQIVALETVVEYTVATYGRASLARLVTALGNHTSWHSLIPAVFNISAAEFEAGWHSYLATAYGE
jgi:hypothetical protein